MDVSYGVEEMFLAEADEGTSDAISIPIGFPFGQSIQTQFYVRVNTFGTLIKKFSEFLLRLVQMDSCLLALLTTFSKIENFPSLHVTLWPHSGMTWTLEEEMGESLMKYTNLDTS